MFRTNKARQLEEKNILLFIQKSEELLNIKKIFDPKDEKVFRRLENSWIILNAIAKLSKLTSSKLRKTEVKQSYDKFEQFSLFRTRELAKAGAGGQLMVTQISLRQKIQRLVSSMIIRVNMSTFTKSRKRMNLKHHLSMRYVKDSSPSMTGCLIIVF